ncbi:hypothetical protein HQ403_01975 [Candidatus Kaiserbacteria bacterium]|nr:hypothetical protein [Candidatus Kaiserbacteria bacterium]
MNNLNFPYSALATVLKEVTKSSKSNFYREKYFGETSVQSFLEGDETAWEDIPFLSRGEIQKFPMHERLYVDEKDVEIIRPTSGTSGAGILPVPRTMSHEGNKLPLNYRLFVSLNVHRLATFSGAQFYYSPSFRRLAGIDSINVDPGDIPLAAHLITLYMPDMLAGPVYALGALSENLPTNVRKKVKAIQVFGEWCSQFQWNEFQRLFPNAKIVSEYASIESQTSVAVPCSIAINEHKQYVHPVPEYVYTEIINPISEEIIKENGVGGELVITTIRPVAFPLIRYRTGDLAQIIRHECECGITTPVLSIDGRLDIDRLRFRKGELNLSEVDRVISLHSDYLNSGDFEVHYKEIVDEDGVFKPQISIHLSLISPDKSTSTLKEALSKSLRIAPDRVYADGVEENIYMSLEIVPLVHTKASTGKKKKIFRDDK